MWYQGNNSLTYYIDENDTVWKMRDSGLATPTDFLAGVVTQICHRVDMPAWGSKCLRAMRWYESVRVPYMDCLKPSVGAI